MIIEIPFTLAQIRAATKAQVITQITNLLNTYTKRQIVLWLFENVVTIADAPVRVYKPDGQIESDIEVDRDIETGVKVSEKQITYSYYVGGEVDEITIVELNGVDVEVSRKVIKHYLDRQPEVL